MTTPRFAQISSVVALVLWLADDIVIARRGQPGDGWLDTVLFLGGGVAMIATVAALGLVHAEGRSRLRRIATAFGAVLAGALLTGVVQLVVVRLQPEDPGWAWGEINLWVLMVVVLVLVWAAPRERIVVSDFR